MGFSILDCTLRDGGYVNNWNFGENNIDEILKYLSNSNIEIIECGFLSSVDYDKDITLFNKVDEIKNILPKKYGNAMLVAMLVTNKEEYDCNLIEECDNNTLTGIRIAFHKYEEDKAIRYAKILMEKGYKLFLQPMGTMSYKDLELLSLIEKINQLNPFAFYIVDTLGSMNKDDLLKMFYLIDNNLNENIQLGFHSHNNLQLSFSNSIELININTARDIIIDSSVFGMGRGAGNLSTELITQYLNDIGLKKYNLNNIFDIIDNHILRIKKDFEWGYSAPYYIAATNKCHPNYAKFLMDTQKLTSKNINDILHSISDEKKYDYDENHIKNLYINYHNFEIDDSKTFDELKNLITNKEVLLLATGTTILTHKNEIDNFISQNNPIIISLNSKISNFDQDFIFISNFKKYRKHLENYANENHNVIVTSNINVNEIENTYILNYNNYLIKNNDDEVFDNVGLIALELLKKISVNKIYLAGFDGFILGKKNTFDNSNAISENSKLYQNEVTKEMLNKILSNTDYEFITPSLYE